MMARLKTIKSLIMRCHTCPRDDRDLLMAAASINLWPVASLLETLSDPARSHKVKVPVDTAPDALSWPSTVIMKIRCDRELGNRKEIIKVGFDVEFARFLPAWVHFGGGNTSVSLSQLHNVLNILNGLHKHLRQSWKQDLVPLRFQIQSLNVSTEQILDGVIVYLHHWCLGWKHAKVHVTIKKGTEESSAARLTFRVKKMLSLSLQIWRRSRIDLRYTRMKVTHLKQWFRVQRSLTWRWPLDPHGCLAW